MNDNPTTEEQDGAAEPENIFGPLLEFIAKEIEKEQRVSRDQMKSVVGRLRELPVRERQLIQDAGIAGYYLGYTDRANGLPGTTDGALACARVMAKCMEDPDVFVGINTDPDTAESLADQLNQRLTRELQATQKAKRENDERFMLERDQARLERDQLRRELSTLKNLVETGEVSDGHHTHNELYRYRMLYNAHAAQGWMRDGISVIKSKRHSDGEECFGGGWFVVVAQLPAGQVSNHYKLDHWDLFDVPEVETAPEWDGHDPEDAAHRMEDYLS